MRFQLLSAVLLGLLCLPLTALAQDPVNVFVQAGTGGLAANGAADSAADLRKALAGKRYLQVVGSPAEADVIVRMESRNERKDPGPTHTYASTSKDGKSATATTEQSTTTVKVMHATLFAGDFQMPLDAEDTVSWRFAAGTMASQVDHWARENGGKLAGRRTGGNALAGRATPSAGSSPDAPRALSSTVPADGAPDSGPGSAGTSASIAPGMTPQQVLALLGEPEKRVSFGQKAMWNYRGMQVVFQDGRVSDVKF